MPSIAISEIVKIGQDSYLVASLKDKSLYSFKLDSQKKIVGLTRISVGERIRDLKYDGKDLYLILETTGSIAVIKDFKAK